jgi:hypothetical protein
MILLWLLGGIVLVTVAYFLPGQSPELWPSLNAAGIAVLVYLIALVAYLVRQPFSTRTRVTVWASVILVCASIGSWWTGMDYTSHWQKETLLKIRGVIGRGILQATIPDTLMTVMKTYYEQGTKNKKSLGQVFKDRYPGVAEGQQFPPSEFDMDRLLFAATIASDTVVLIGEDRVANGRKADFKNHDGKTGRIQSRGTLTVKGLSYESEN